MTQLAAFLSVVQTLQPRTALVLGSGLLGVPRRFQVRSSLPFTAIPGLVATTVAGHSGRIEVGICAEQPMVVFHGRLHFYEGHSWERVARPIEFAAELGIRRLILTNAAGGIHETLDPGCLMLIRDHLFWQRPHAWRDAGPETCSTLVGHRPSLYSTSLVSLFREAATAQSVVLRTGIYAAVTGPCYETPAEIRALLEIGADAVGMSTAHEIETGRRFGMECAAVSCITNRAAGLSDTPLNHREVLEAAARQADRLSNLLEWVIRSPVDPAKG